jgi:hypothetical protein
MRRHSSEQRHHHNTWFNEKVSNFLEAIRMGSEPDDKEAALTTIVRTRHQGAACCIHDNELQQLEAAVKSR